MARLGLEAAETEMVPERSGAKEEIPWRGTGLCPSRRCVWIKKSPPARASGDVSVMIYPGGYIISLRRIKSTVPPNIATSPSVAGSGIAVSSTTISSAAAEPVP